MNKPNVLFIMCDQMRQDAIGCNGNKTVKTPNIDRLAKEGVNFKNAFTPSPICVPARASLTTGLYPHKCTGQKNNSGALKGGIPTIAGEFQSRGYDTYAMGKLHYLPYAPPGEKRTLHGFQTAELTESGRMLKKYDPLGEQSGLEDYNDYLKTVGWEGFSRGNGLGNNDIFPATSAIPEEHYVDTWVADRTITHLNNHIKNSPDKPFFMFTSFPKPHSAYDPPYPYDRLYDPRKMPDCIGDIGKIKEREIELLVEKYKKYGWDTLSPQAKKNIKAHYYGLISLQDKQIGRLLGFLEEQGIKDNTIIVYTADHGDLLGDFGLYFKENFYNASVRIPMIISYPSGIKGGRVLDQLVGLQDIMPTLMELTGTPLNHEVDGMSLLPAINEDKKTRRFYVSQCHESPEQQYMVCGEDWKFIYHQNGGVEELYDMQDDYNELHNLAQSDEPHIREKVKEMRDYLLKWCVENNDAPMVDKKALAKVGIEQNTACNNSFNVFGRRYL
ncbi:MAG: sulfatase-like hydrolase/transferase [Firmicutes bacterium]|nr:sulfatase-like hydrolase/transferase [Bacillota bacterium]